MPGLLTDRNVLVMGVANQRSIAWAVARAVVAQSGRLALTYQSERVRPRLEKLAAELGDVPLIECDVSSDDAIAKAMKKLGKRMPVLHGLVHSIAYAPAHDLQGSFVETTREGYAVANDVSAYSLIAASREARRADDAGRLDRHHDLRGLAPRDPQLQRDGTGEGVARVERALPGGRPGAGRDPRERGLGRPHPHRRRAQHQGFAGMLDLLATHTPLRRNVTAEEVADATVFLLSDLARASPARSSTSTPAPTR